MKSNFIQDQTIREEFAKSIPPRSKISLSRSAKSLFPMAAVRNKCPVEIGTGPKSRSILSACVPFPEPFSKLKQKTNETLIVWC